MPPTVRVRLNRPAALAGTTESGRITTHDGDVINITFHGSSLQPGRAQQGVDIMTVVGGTGRFEEATGEMEGALYPDRGEWPRALKLKQTIQGWICY